MNQQKRILRIDASARNKDSDSKRLGDRLIEKLTSQTPGTIVIHRDLYQQAEFIDSNWVNANLTPAEQRSDSQRQRLAASDRQVAELEAADHIVLTTPMYNFGLPAPLKSWIDQICRAGLTFKYTANGPVGLLDDKRVDIIITTGGVALDSPADFVSSYLRHIFSFIGIDNTRIIAADQMNIDAERSFQRALSQIDQVLALETAA